MLKDEFKKKNNERKKIRVNSLSSNMRDTAKSTPPLIFFKIKIKNKNNCYVLPFGLES
jgi:hypothetical protein